MHHLKIIEIRSIREIQRTEQINKIQQSIKKTQKQYERAKEQKNRSTDFAEKAELEKRCEKLNGIINWKITKIVLLNRNGEVQDKRLETKKENLRKELETLRKKTEAMKPRPEPVDARVRTKMTKEQEKEFNKVFNHRGVKRFKRHSQT